jgi:hypothetical protein
MKYTQNRKYRDFITEEVIEKPIIKKRPILLNKKKSVLNKITDFLKKK